MTDMIPRDAAAAVCDKHSYSHNPYVSGRMADAAAEIRAIPSIDPAAIREAALREALDAVSRAAWKHNGDDSYSAGLEDGARNQNEADYDAILALIGEKK